MPRTSTDGPKQTPAAERVRERFAATLTSRIEAVSKFVNQLADDRIDAYFEAALSKGENPYDKDHYDQKVASIVVFDATKDLASGNKVDVKQAYEAVAKNDEEWGAVVARLQKKLTDAGYEVFFDAASDKAKVTVMLHDPEFEDTVQNALSADT